ncbi:MAG: dihydrofolate reductase [Candidatus Paceibacterota bacterium]|jgi:dihydrofolate reductase
MKKEVNIIVAIGKNGEIGKNNHLIWKISDDLKRFKALTTGHPIIMGRKTFESIGKPLPNRTNIIVTRNIEYRAMGCIVCNSLEKAVEEGFQKDDQIFIIGGQEIYSQAIKIANRLYLTLIDEESDADAFFPNYDNFKKVISTEDQQAPEGLKYKYVVLEK